MAEVRNSQWRYTQFNKNCKVLTHSFVWEHLSDKERSTAVVVNTLKRKAKQSVIQFMRDRNVYGTRARYACTACLNYFEEMGNACQAIGDDSDNSEDEMMQEDNSLGKEDGMLSGENQHDQQNVICKKNPSSLSVASVSATQDCEKTAAVLDAFESKKELKSAKVEESITYDSLSFADMIRKQCQVYSEQFHVQRVNELLRIDKENYIPSGKLKDFLYAVCDVDSQPETGVVLAIRMFELLLRAVDHRFIGAYSTRESILCHAVDNSKLSIVVRGNCSPNPSYSKLRDLLLSDSETTTKVPHRDAIVVIDNFQFVGKTYNIFRSAIPVAKVCSVVSLLNSQVLNVQRAPITFIDLGSDDRINELLSAYTQKHKLIFRKFRNKFIMQEIRSLRVATNVTASDKLYSSFCDTTYSALCGSMKKPVSQVELKIHDPLVKDPCSFESVEEAIRSILQISDLNVQKTTGCRRHIALVCDGNPMILILRLLQEKHPEWVNILLMKPGWGHYEHTMLKSVISFAWDIVFNRFALISGFDTDKALLYFQRATDHHKAYQALEIVLHGLARELLRPIVDKIPDSMFSKADDEILNLVMNLIDEVEDATYAALYNLTFTLLFAIKLFRIGVRRNESQLIMAAILGFAPLFYIRSNFHYRRITVWYIAQILRLHPNLVAFLEKDESFTRTTSNKGQGADYVLEEVHQVLSGLEFRGQPRSFEKWKELYGKVQLLADLRNRHFSDMVTRDSKDTAAASDSPSANHVYQMSILLEKWQVELRKSNIIHPDHPSSDTCGLSGMLSSTYNLLYKTGEVRFTESMFKVLTQDPNNTEIKKYLSAPVTAVDEDKMGKLQYLNIKEISQYAEALISQLTPEKRSKYMLLIKAAKSKTQLLDVVEKIIP